MRHLILLLPLGVLGMAQEPRYAEWTKYLLSLPDYRLEQLRQGRWPYLEVLRKDRLREYQQNREDATARDHEWRLPLSSLEATREVARDLRKAWQRFEERYYWRVITELNNPSFWFAYCLFGLRGDDLNPPLPEVHLTVPSEAVDTAFLERLTPFPAGRMASAGLHRLDRYLPVPQIPREEFCDGLSMSLLPIMYIPGFKVLFQGQEIFRTPGYPSRPLWFNEGEANARVERAMRHALERYYPEYLQEASRALLTPRPQDPSGLLGSLGGNLQDLGAPRAYLPVPWQGHLLGGGSVVAPVYTELFPRDPGRLWQGLEGMWQTYQGILSQRGTDLERAYLYLHFYRSARSLLGLPGLEGLRGMLLGLVEGPLRNLFRGIPALSPCTGSLDEVVGCASHALMGVDRALKAGRDVAGLTGGRPQGEPLKAEPESPGLWKFEEAKRWLPPSSLPVYEGFGYMSLFQGMNLLESTTVPDIRNINLSEINLGNWVSWAWSQLSRLVVYWHVPITIDIRVEYCPPCVLAYPSPPLEGPAQPLGVPPYVLPFVGERTHWRWISVPEGYEVPGVRGTPYRILADLGGLTPDLRVLYRPLTGR